MIESLYHIIDKEKLKFHEFDLSSINLKGLYFDDYILLDKSIETTAERTCILAEELGHYYTTTENILDQGLLHNQKEELKARRWAANKLIDPNRFVDAFKVGVRNRWELSEFLGLTEEFIEESLVHMKAFYGEVVAINEYRIHFDPLWVYKSFEEVTYERKKD